MQPNQQNQPGGTGPQPPYTPTPIPQHPGFGPNAMPLQNPNGQYEVVPPLPVGNNNGHTGHNAYEFIMSPAATRRSRLGGNAFLVRVGIILGGAVLLMILVAIAISAFGPKNNTSSLVALAQRQQEIIRIADSAANQVQGQDTRNFVTNVDFSITSSQQQMVVYLAAHGTKLNAKTLAADKNPQTDALLANATSTNTYDPAVAQALTQQLQTYETLLKTAFKQTSSNQTKQLLQDCYTSADKLLQQAKALSASS